MKIGKYIYPGFMLVGAGAGGSGAGALKSIVRFTVNENFQQFDLGFDSSQNVTVNWGDGNGAIDAGTFLTFTHTYADAGTYTVSVTTTDSDNSCNLIQVDAANEDSILTVYVFDSTEQIVVSNDGNPQSLCTSFRFQGDTASQVFLLTDNTMTQFTAAAWSSLSSLNIQHGIGITTLDLSGAVQLATVTIGNAINDGVPYALLQNFVISDASPIIYCQITAECDSDVVDTIWAALDGNGQLNGGGVTAMNPPAAPSGTGLAAIISLEAKGWDCIYDTTAQFTVNEDFDEFAITGLGTIAMVDWGDGTIEVVPLGTFTHTYATPGSYNVVVTAPRISELTFGTTATDSLISIEQLPRSMVGLTISTVQSALTTIDFSGCVNLQSIALTAATPNLADFLGINDATVLDNVTIAQADITTFDTSSFTLLQSLDFGDNGAHNFITSLDVTANNILNVINVDQQSLSVGNVSDILEQLDAHGNSNGLANLMQDPAAIPDAGGQTAATNLVGKGWTVNIDS